MSAAAALPRVLLLAVLALILLGVLPGALVEPVRYALVLDDSGSMRLRHPGEPAGQLAAWRRFDAGRHPVVFAGERREAGAGAASAPEPLTDIGGALREAAALFPPAAEKRLLLVTDGFWLPESLNGLAARLKRDGVRVYARRPRAAARQAGVLDVSAPERVFLLEPFTVSVRVGASSAGPVAVAVRRNGVIVMEREVDVGWSGIASLEYLTEAEQVGSATYTGEIKDRPETAVSVGVLVASAPRVLYVTEDPQASGGLLAAFRRAGIDVRVAPAAELAGEEGPGSDIIVLDDIPPAAIGPGIEERLRELVGVRGRGLLAIGGRKGLATEEYRETALEAMLPVTVGYSAPPPTPRAALVLVLDTSFSMAFRGRGEKAIHSDKPRKIDVALESARQVARAFRPGDRLGILGNSTDLFWIHPLGEVADAERVRRDLDRVVPKGDGLNFYSAVREAYQALRDDPAPVRHIVVFGDAEDIDQYEVLGEGHAHDLVRRIAADGVTLSVLSIGQLGDKDVPFLREAALLGKGDFYLISALAALPRYFVSEYRRLASRYYVEEEIEAIVGDYSPVLAGIEDQLPTLGGIDTLTARAGSRTQIGTVLGAPLVVTGRYGRGKTAVFASDNGSRWAPRWLSWGGGRQFWLRLLFSVSPEETGAHAFTQAAGPGDLPGGLTLQYRGSAAAYPPWDELRVSLEPEGGGAQAVGKREERGVRLERVGLRTYRAAAPTLAPGLYRAAVVAAGEDGEPLERLAVRVGRPVETLPLPGDWGPVERLLEETGGGWVEEPEQLRAGAAGTAWGKGSIRLALLALALALILVETLVNDRRWR